MKKVNIWKKLSMAASHLGRCKYDRFDQYDRILNTLRGGDT